MFYHLLIMFLYEYRFVYLFKKQIRALLQNAYMPFSIISVKRHITKVCNITFRINSEINYYSAIQIDDPGRVTADYFYKY